VADIAFVVFGTHEYQWALGPFGHLFAKYWGDETVTYVGDRLAGPLPDNIEFMRVPCYSEGVWPWRHWFGNGVRETLKILGEDLAAIFLPDDWIRRPVQSDVVDAMARHMLEAGNVVRGNLADDTNLEGHSRTVATREEIEIVVCDDVHHCGNEAGTALSPALWDRKKLIDILEPHWGLWATEKLGTEKMARKYPDWISVGTRPAALGRVNSIRDGQRRQAHGEPPKRVWVEGLSEEDRRAVRAMIPGKYDIVE